MRWIDNHCHLGWSDDHDPTEADAEVVDVAPVEDLVAAMLVDARAEGVERLISVGTDVEHSAQAIAVAERWPEAVWATVGLHPHEAKHGLAGIEELLDNPRVVAVGECGLDYYYEHSPRDMQHEMFAAQIELAHRHNLALVIHTRDAWDDTFDLLDAEGVPERTVLHCFTGGPEELDECLERGMFVSFSGIVTFPSAKDVQAAAARCPLDRVLVETDSPFLAPIPHRGKRNRPALVPLVGAAVATAMGCDVAAVADASWNNAAHVYALPSN